ncbi:MAG: redoxin family protein [Alphaproteobacteria bacterium]|nr:redoxin family protein [Alphaproteobacteria bacterium]MDE2341672.1 redoxin family protein [Alphaproteobacteria bacterium]
MTKRLWLWLPFAGFALVLGLLIHGLVAPESHDIPSQWVGQPMPHFDLPAASSSRPGFSSANLTAGKPHLVNIFASWCIPCAAEAPQLVALTKAGVEVDGIALRDRKVDLDAFLERNGNPYARIGSDTTSSVAMALGSTGVPETYLIDSKGIIRLQHIGVLYDDDVPRLIAQMKALH